MFYRVIITGKLQTGQDKEQVAKRLAHLFKRDQRDMQALLSGKRRVIKKQLEKSTADQLCLTLMKAGVEALVEADTKTPQAPAEAAPSSLNNDQLVEQAEARQRQGHCPKCDFAPAGDEARLAQQTACPNCGAYAHKYINQLYQQRERARLDALRDRQFRQAAKLGGGISEYLPAGLFRWARWVFVGIGALILLTGGYSVFKLPRYELIYNPQQPIVRCPDIAADAPSEQILEALFKANLYEEGDRCMMNPSACKPFCRADYALQLVNTGLRPLQQVVVRLDQSWLDKASGKPAFLNYDRVQRLVSSRSTEQETSYALGLMKPTEQIVMRAALLVDRREDAPSWPELLREVKTPDGEVYEGLPALSIITRMALKVFGAFSLTDAASTLANRFLDDEPVEQIADWAEVRPTADPDQVDLYLAQAEEKTTSAGRRPFFEHRIIIRNHGGKDATDVELQLDLADGFSLMTSISGFSIPGEMQHNIVALGLEQRGAHNPCRGDQGRYHCRIGKVRHQDTATLFLRLAANKLHSDGETRQYEHAVEVHGKEFEAMTDNNHLVLVSRSDRMGR